MLYRAALLFVVPVLVAVAAAPAQAQTVDDQCGAVFGLLDSDSDGVILLQEAHDVVAEYMEKLRAVSGDDEAAVAALHDEYGYALQPLQFLQADTDDDLEVTGAELEAFITALVGGETPGISESDCEVFARETVVLEWEWLRDSYDLDGDSQFSSQEWLGSDATDEARQDFATCDDGDGRLTQEETIALLARRARREHGYSNE